MTEQKNLPEIIRSQIKCIDDINYKIGCIDKVLDMTYNAIHYMPEKAEDYIESIPVCSCMLDRLQQNLLNLYDDISKSCYNFEQAGNTSK